jgi:hypothetical protein
MVPRAALVLLALAACLLGSSVPAVAARGADPLLTARRLYNEGKLDAALEAARQAVAIPSRTSSARLVIGRIHLERYRQASAATDLEGARTELRAVDPRVLDQRERIELQVGLATLLYYEERYGAAAELLDPIVEASATLAPDAHERALDWWATALDRQAQSSTDRVAAFMRISERMEQELRRDPTSMPANYWLAASVRAAGDLDRAMSAASAAWIRAALAGERGTALRTDLDRLVNEAIIPDKAARLPPRDRKTAIATLTAEWESFKKIW